MKQFFLSLLSTSLLLTSCSTASQGEGNGRNDGDDVLTVAIGFEIRKRPVTDLSLDDFCLDIQ